MNYYILIILLALIFIVRIYNRYFGPMCLIFKFILIPFKKISSLLMSAFKNSFRRKHIKAVTGKKMHSKFYTFQLKKDTCYEADIYRVNRGCVVIFTCGPSLYGSDIKFFTNAPESYGSFLRSSYHQIPFSNDNDSPFVKISFETPGSFHFYLTVNEKKDVSGYILVEPDFMLGGKLLPLNSLKYVTVLSKCLGPLSRWNEKMTIIKKSGYNMVHFTPIQKLGESNSAYSICDQLSLNPLFGSGKTTVKPCDVKQLMDKMRKEMQVMSICDVVLNHTANETPWLSEHPECSYNLVNSPHLRPAYILDSLLHQLTIDVANGLYEQKGVPPVIDCENHLEALRHILWSEILKEAKIQEMFVMDVSNILEEFKGLCGKITPSLQLNACGYKLKINQDPLFRRLKSSIDMDSALKLYNVYRNDCFDEDSRQKQCAQNLKQKLDELNDEMTAQVNSHLDAAVNNCLANIRYFRLQEDGPKVREVSLKNPLVPRYFVEKGKPGEAQLKVGGRPDLVMAHNGWIMGDDPLRSFADSHSNVYLRRELIAWGDSVKLRFGETPDDCPFLWKKMKEYVEMTATIFDGVRLDNCHSTPIHVAQYLLDAARKIKPNLFVVAELFTNSDRTDNLFVNKLGITSLIRESMSAWDSHELGRLVYRYGGKAVGSLQGLNGCKLSPGVAQALFFDLTHDNPSPVDKRSVYDLLPSAALVAMASAATGSNFGYDHLVPHHIHVVDEEREYMGTSQESEFDCQGIVKAKAFLNNLHSYLAENNFDQVFVDQIDNDIVCVTRHNSITLESYLMFAYTAFEWPSSDNSKNGSGKGVTVTAATAHVDIEAYLYNKADSRFSKVTDYVRHETYINGLSEFKLFFKHIFTKDQPEMVKFDFEKGQIRIKLTQKFQPGSIIGVKIFPTPEAKEAVRTLNTFTEYETLLNKCLTTIDLVDINYILFKCADEEPDGTYSVPGYGNFVYAGLQGVMSVMEEIVEKDDQAHPVCCNIREGNWLADYIGFRLMKNMKTRYFGEVVKDRLDLLKVLPAGMKPYYFHSVLSMTYSAVREHAFSLMSPFIKEGSELVKMLALSSLQFVGSVESSSLPQLSDQIHPPAPKGKPPTIAAGLPHFSSGYMRSWGRDTFISLRGLLLLTGRFDEARYHILGYGGCVRHGLIPNLLDSGTRPRFNCRDAVWWWLHSIQSFVMTAPNGEAILTDTVNRLFPSDNLPPTSQDMPLIDVIQECLQVHFQGLCFRERFAGKEIDEHMTSLGFDNQIGVHPATGFVFGGNEWNCGTWMDKMGSSNKAGTAGSPATPRDGSAVELVCLCYAVVKWLKEIHAKGIYPYSGVTRTLSNGGNVTWTWSEWSSLIQNNFEREFWISEKSSDPLTFRCSIYKDSVNSSQPWADFRLRPNFLVGMAVAPDLFDKYHSRRALDMVDSILLGPLGLKTLDPEDMWYAGDYDNSDDSHEAKTANGFNYHQGPEWLWPMGYYLRCSLNVREDVGRVKQILSAHWSHLVSTHWRGLPELTNSSGSHCSHGCPTQAWSVATILEAIYDLEKVANETGKH